MRFDVRRVRADEGGRIRDLRLDAVRDPVASIAFLRTYEEEAAHPDEFWRDRAVRAAAGDAGAQFVAEADGEWIGTLTVLRRETGTRDHHGKVLDAPRADVVGVYVRPDRRGAGVLDALIDAAARWVRDLGGDALTLDVHRDNARARAAYARSGFVETGLRFTGVIGPELEMRRDLLGGGRLLLVNGPNLNLLGIREPGVYGTATLADVVRLTTQAAGALGYAVRAVQSNHEGDLIDAIHAARTDCAGIVINPGGLTHTSVSLRDALTGVGLPFAEVHISDVYAREEFRHFSYLHDVAAARVVGRGVDGYADAVRELARHLPPRA